MDEQRCLGAPSYFIARTRPDSFLPEPASDGLLLRSLADCHVPTRAHADLLLGFSIYFSPMYRVSIQAHSASAGAHHWQLESTHLSDLLYIDFSVSLFNVSFFSAGLIRRGDILGILLIEYVPFIPRPFLLDNSDLGLLYARGNAVCLLTHYFHSGSDETQSPPFLHVPLARLETAYAKPERRIRYRKKQKFTKLC